MEEYPNALDHQPVIVDISVKSFNSHVECLLCFREPIKETIAMFIIERYLGGLMLDTTFDLIYLIIASIGPYKIN